VLPRPDAGHAKRHDPVPLEEILSNIEAVAHIVDSAKE
jgi:hypothetical protein